MGPGLKTSLMLPTHTGAAGFEFPESDVIAQLAIAAERASFDAVHVTDHPVPPTTWVESGGHHALDPMVTLTHVASASTTLRLHTHLIVDGYRNPFILAKAAATIDLISRGRLILGIGAGYLEPEFAALGAVFEHRNRNSDEVVEALRAAWTGEPVDLDGQHFKAAGNAMLPRPFQRPGPPIWIGGNRRLAQLRAVRYGDGWAPLPAGDRRASLTRTAKMSDAADLARGIEGLRELAAEHGRTLPLEIVFVPLGSRTFKNCANTGMIIAGAEEMAAVGVTYLAAELPAESPARHLRLIEIYSENVLPRIAEIGARAPAPERHEEEP
jgi:probable F420-dependent oxidoreductase